MSDALMFVLAVAAFAWGLSLASYRWVALQNSWPMGVWQAERPILPRLIGLAAGGIALISAVSLGGAMMPLVLVSGLVGAFVWIHLLKIRAQSALLLAPVATVLTMVGWALGTS